MTVSNVRVKVCEERGTTTAPTSGTTTQPGSETVYSDLYLKSTCITNITTYTETSGKFIPQSK